MPQLDTSTWLTTVISSSMALFMVMQLKISSQVLPMSPSIKPINVEKTNNPWELKWTKICLPLLLPPLY